MKDLVDKAIVRFKKVLNKVSARREICCYVWIGCCVNKRLLWSELVGQLVGARSVCGGCVCVCMDCVYTEDTEGEGSRLNGPSQFRSLSLHSEC